VEEILASFDAEVVAESSGDLVGGCPVHGGDNRTGFRCFPTGQWRCWTHQCHETFGGDPMGLVWGLLVARDGVDPGFPGAIAFCRRLLGGLPTAESGAIEEVRFAGQINRLAMRPRTQPATYSVAEVTGRLRVPSEYFVGRGYPADILSAFHVGDPLEDKPGPLRGRAIVPLLDPAGERVVGFSGRLRLPSVEKSPLPKWLHQPDGLLRGDLLYGWHLAADEIQKTGTVFLVEGCPDVWAWHAQGIRNAVGLFGTTVTDFQQVLLERSGALEVVLGQDNDEAGEAGAASSARRLGAAFTVRRRLPPGGTNDWGEAFEKRLTWER
jgi:hypothetical protein